MAYDPTGHSISWGTSASAPTLCLGVRELSSEMPGIGPERRHLPVDDPHEKRGGMGGVHALSGHGKSTV
jgi:hypothetical protein